jgi:hypothetical protein
VPYHKEWPINEAIEQRISVLHDQFFKLLEQSSTVRPPEESPFQTASLICDLMHIE